jgi:hypothetical protein
MFCGSKNDPTCKLFELAVREALAACPGDYPLPPLMHLQMAWRRARSPPSLVQLKDIE